LKPFPFDRDSGTVLQDAFSSKYRNALHSGTFEDAVKKYRQKKKAQTEEKGDEGITGGLNIPTKVRPLTLEESSTRAQKSLESLPIQTLEQARVFHRHIQYFVQTEPGGDVPPDLKIMLDDISRAQKLDERVKDEILQDEDARNVSEDLPLTLPSAEIIESAPRHYQCSVLRVSPPLYWYPSIPDPVSGALRELIETAENALSALAERDLLAARYREQQRANGSGNPESHASGSGTYHDETRENSDAS